MSEDNKAIKLRTNKQELSKPPKEIVLLQHIDRTFSIPFWLPLLGIVLGLMGELLMLISNTFSKKK